MFFCLDLESNDSYGTSTLTIDQEHSSPLPGNHHHKFLPGNSSPSSHQYMSSPSQHVTTFTADNGFVVGKLKNGIFLQRHFIDKTLNYIIHYFPVSKKTCIKKGINYEYLINKKVSI